MHGVVHDVKRSDLAKLDASEAPLYHRVKMPLGRICFDFSLLGLTFKYTLLQQMDGQNPGQMEASKR